MGRKVNFFDVQYFLDSILFSLFVAGFVLFMALYYSWTKESTDKLFSKEDVEIPVEFDAADSFLVEKLPFIPKGEKLPKGLSEINWRNLNQNLFSSANLSMWKWFPGEYTTTEDYITRGRVYIYSELLGLKIPLFYKSKIKRTCFTSDGIVYKNGEFVIKARKVGVWQCIYTNILSFIFVIAIALVISFAGSFVIAGLITFASYYAIRIFNRKKLYKEVYYDDDLADFLKDKLVFLIIKNNKSYLIYRYSK